MAAQPTPPGAAVKRGSHSEQTVRLARFAAALRSGAHTPSSRALVEGGGAVRKTAVHADYALARVLGEGGFATVYLATSKATRAERAVKVVDLNKLDSEGLASLELEIQTLRRVSHPNITRLYECYIHGETCALVLEAAFGGELFDRVITKEHYSEREARRAFAQMVEASVEIKLSCPSRLAEPRGPIQIHG